MLWAGIVKDRLIGPYKMDSSVKLNSETYSQFLNDTFFKWYKRQSRQFKLTCTFMHDSVPAHVSKFTRSYLEGKGFSGNKNMAWPAESPDLNSIDNL